MISESKPDGTMILKFDDYEREVVDNYAKWQGVEPEFFVAIALQTAIRTMVKLFPQKLMMPGYLNRELRNHPNNRCHRCHQTQTEEPKDGS